MMTPRPGLEPIRLCGVWLQAEFGATIDKETPERETLLESGRTGVQGHQARRVHRRFHRAEADGLPRMPLR